MNLPASFTEYTRALLGVEEYEKLVSALQQEPPVLSLIHIYVPDHRFRPPIRSRCGRRVLAGISRSCLLGGTTKKLHLKSIIIASVVLLFMAARKVASLA